MSHERYEMVVGLEVHVQLKTGTKAFCACRAAFGAPANANTCPVCLALPGALPVLNEAAVRLAARAALALGCTVHAESIFARKHYFYPDLPKGYQISQFDRPLATGGALAGDAGRAGDVAPPVVRLTRVHLEEDAGKSIHDRYPAATAIDLNRSGVPLIEIVSEPDLRGAREAGAWLRELKLVLEYLAVSDANMEEGSLRVDANVSARPHGDTALGTKTEIKNMNSFSGVERALEAEFARQCHLLDRGEPVVQQTMLWDGARGDVRPARTKEESHDYRYFPEPDLPPLRLSPEWIASVRADLPELPVARRGRFQRALGLSAYDAQVLTATPRLADYFEDAARAHGDAKAAANWIMGEVLAYLNETGRVLDDLAATPHAVASLLDLVRDGTLSHSAAKRVFAVMVQSGEDPRAIAAREGLSQVGDAEQLRVWVDEVFARHPDESRRFLAGEKKLLGVLVGLVIRASGGRADPRKVNQLLAARLARAPDR
jgi:aspartyl-tRNA(Asn)/glutamyl-tRNA(Gln) amidotransferase subunit B